MSFSDEFLSIEIIGGKGLAFFIVEDAGSPGGLGIAMVSWVAYS